MGPYPALVLFILLFADDWKITARGRMFAENILMALLFLEVFCFPLRWAKTHGGLMFDYIGYWLDYTTFAVGISFRRASWLMDWVAHLIIQQQVDIQELREVLGRFNFAAQVLEHDKPFLGPIYAWASALPLTKGSIPVPAMLLIIFSFHGHCQGRNNL